MIHWITTAFSTYVLHTLHNNGYQWWSGPGGDLAFLGAATAVYRKHNCHVRHCYRIGRHPVEGTDWVVCRKHHPGDHPKHYLPTAKDVKIKHEHSL